MNKQATHAIRKHTQAGFTLIELIVVIVILGILAATALPKFSSLSSDARVASLKAAQGALSTTSAMVHGQYLINTTAQNFAYEGTQVNVTNGYAAADNGTTTAAGLNASDYTITVGVAAATANAPAVPAGSVLIQPKSVASTTSGLNCYLMYTQAANTTTPPAMNLNAATNNCN
jgi:MSHA pilin protein MshA